MLTADYDFELPAELIAQQPPATRTASRMLVLDRAGEGVTHRVFADLPAYLRPGDLLVLNDTRVFPARLRGAWADTGGQVELLLLEPAAASDAVGAAPEWFCLCGSGRRARPGLRMSLAAGEATAELLAVLEEGRVRVRFESAQPLERLLDAHGQTPVPPYIARGDDPAAAALDRERYQTVYARHRGAVAAPTAGLHFDAPMLDRLRRAGVEIAFVTLHVGPGTFKPVKSETIEAHRMESERYEVPEETAAALRACRGRGGRIVAVGSTTVRTLETMARDQGGEARACAGRSTLFLYPPARFALTDAMLTNFHLPRSTLLMMVAALAGRERVLAAYCEAVAQRYRFYSYGDCMLVL